MKRDRKTVLTVISAAALIAAAFHTASLAAQKHSPFKVLHTWTVGGEGGWDYLEDDASNHRLYIAHNATVEVLDTKSGEKIGSITGLQGTHGIALAADGRHGFISDGKGNVVVVFDRHSLAKITTIPAGTNPDGIVYDPVTKTVWAFNGSSSDATGIDAISLKVIATVKLPGKPEFPVADGKGNIYDNIEDKNEIVKIDARSKNLVAVMPLTNCDSPSGLAIDRKRGRLFSVCDNKAMAITMTAPGKSGISVPIGEGPDADRYDALRNLAFSSNGRSGDMTVIDASGQTPKVLQALPTAAGARTMALDEITGHLFTVSAKFGPKPEASAGNPHARPTPIPGSFFVLEIGH